jgi:hypothetical protein
MADLNPKEESDKKLLDTILQSLLNILKPLKQFANTVADLNDSSQLDAISRSLKTKNESPIYIRTPQNEIILICLRTVSILLSKSKYQRSGDNCNFIIQTLLHHLCQFNLIDVCLNLMKFIYFDYWLKQPAQTDSTDDVSLSSTNTDNNGLMKLSAESRYHDELAPYFVRDPLNKDSFVIPPPNLSASTEPAATTLTATTATTAQTKPAVANTNDLFDNYTELLTEILIRLPYQMKKLCLGSSSSGSTASASNPSDLMSLSSAQHHLNLSQITNMFEFSSWTHYLCEYLVLPQCYYLKRLIKKLLQILCGSKDKYRKFKDQHILTACIKHLTSLCSLSSSPTPVSLLGLGSTISQASESLSTVSLNSAQLSNLFAKQANTQNIKLTYMSLLKLVDHLKTILEVAISRTLNWQRFCVQNPTTILYLIELALLMGVDSNGSGIDSSNLNSIGNVASASTSVIVPNILQLLLCALGGTKSSSQSSKSSTAQQTSSTQPQIALLNAKPSSSSKAQNSGQLTSALILNDDNLCSILVNSLTKNVSRDTLVKFVRTYLLEAAQPSVRWTLHSLLYSVYKNSTAPNQDQIYDILLQMWPYALASYGIKASQYVDLIGYIIIKSSASQSQTCYENSRIKDFLQRAIELFQAQNTTLATHPNSSVYNTLSNLVNDFDGYYLEADPCFICNNIETAIVNLKLNSIKADARFTTNQQIFKLTGPHLISKIVVKISEIRKSKMVSVINVYYTSKSVQSIVDLKMNNKVWTKAKRVSVQPAQQEVKIDFQMPIIACNLIVEYSDFYDRDPQTNTETTILQCPRCSASVPANPGVCNTCGENVFQCHKCRAINYDERDPFLCNSCGFCKFAKFDFTVVGKSCCAVDPIETEEDRKQTLQNISNLLDRADKIYYTLSQQTKPALEALLIKHNEQNVLEKFISPTSLGLLSSSGSLNASELQQLNYNNLIPGFSANTFSATNSNGVIGIRLTPLTVINSSSAQSGAQAPPVPGKSSAAQPPAGTPPQLTTSSVYINKTVQSIIQKYTIECKTKFEELTKIILKLNLCRKELREYDKQFKSTNPAQTTTNASSASVTRKNSTVYDSLPSQLTRLHSQLSSLAASSLIVSSKLQQPKNNCFGCASASIDSCITLFRALLCANNLTPSSAQSGPALLLNYVKAELCKHGILEELIYFSLRRNSNLLFSSANASSATPAPAAAASSSAAAAAQPAPATATTTAPAPNTAPSTAPTGPNSTNIAPAQPTNAQLNQNQTQSHVQQRMYDRDVINLIYLLIKDNPDGSERFQRLIMEKVEAFLTPIMLSAASSERSDANVVSSLNQFNITSVANSPVKHEMMLLSSLMTKQEDSCWEMRLRLVVHILLRSLNVASLSSSSLKLKVNQSIKYNNPVVVECLTLPCLRILNHVCKTSTNLALLSQLATSSASIKPSAVSKPRQTLFTPSGAAQTAGSSLNRYYSEPAEVNYLQMQASSQLNALNTNHLSVLPQLNELDPNEFLQSKHSNSYYEKWLQMSKQCDMSSKLADKAVLDELGALQPELIKVKAKYFAAWRKYTLKKRKQQQQQQTIKPNENKQAQPVQVPEAPASALAKETSLSHVLPSIYDYDLKSKWLKHCLFCPSSKSVRQLACNVLQNIFLFYSNSSQPNNASSTTNPTSANTQTTSASSSNQPFLSSETNSSRKFQLAELLSQFLDECGNADECFGEYLSLFKAVINDKDCKYRLVLRCGILNKIETLLHREIKYLSELERLSESSSYAERSSLLSNFGIGNNVSSSCGSSYPSLSTNLTLGYSVKSLTELLSIFLKENNIKNKFKGHLIATVLNSYLSLKKLVFQRTKLIEEAQEKLLNTLEQMTSGTEIETRKFMSICIDTVNNFDLDDLVTPVFIFERLCNIIYPEEVVDNKEFLLILEKDPNQEDYLQGRMLGNPYSSNEPGLGPLMRNIKNKICTDCELIALLEDDNGMELLVNNKIISLDLSVRDVHKKVWLSEVLSEHEPMRIVYRMTGLSGDATEDIIDNLDGKGNDSAKNDEEIYRMADELAHNGALAVMLERLSAITQQNFTFGKPLLGVLLKLVEYALKLAINRKQIIQAEMKAITTMLQTLNMMLKIEQIEPNKIGVHLAEQLLNIMELILTEASKQPADVYNEFSALCGDTEQLEFLLNNIKCNFVRSHPNLLEALMRLVPFLSFGDEKKMKSLISYFSAYYSTFDEFDRINLAAQTNAASTNEEMLHLECFSVIVNGIEVGAMGKRLRDMMRDGGVAMNSIEYLIRHSPVVTTYLNSDYDLWKDFISRNSLPYVLRILTGLCRSHESIQDLIGESCIPILHKLEQFSSGNLVGILAEDLLVALKQNLSSKVAAAIEGVRNQTKAEKKKLAMAMRQKQLNQLGMKTNDKGQLIAADPSSTLKSMADEVEEEKGHICCICREGYKYHPQKVLAIYTFTKKAELEAAYEAKTRKTLGYSTVTHFNLVHIDCHTNAIRSARTCRDEWENAALQNANTKCNGIFPIWGPEVAETLFSNALARHNNYLLEATGIRDSSYVLSVHDLKLLLVRFAENLSFSEESGGGGRESNVNLIPYMIHAILYSVNTAKYVTREERNLATFLEASEKLVSNSFECDNVFYYLAMSLVVMKPADWQANKVKFLQRILLTAHARLVNTPSSDKQKLASTNLLEFKSYKASLLFIGIVNLLFKYIHLKVAYPGEDQQQSWTEKFAMYIRQSDIALMEACRKVLKEFEQELMVCEDWVEIFDVLGKFLLFFFLA